MRRKERESLKLGVAADEGDKDLTGIRSNPQGQMAQPPLGLEIHVHGPGRGLQIRLERGDQTVDAGIEHRTAVHIDNLVAAAAVIASAYAATVFPFQRDDGPIAITQGLLGGEDGLARQR